MDLRCESAPAAVDRYRCAIIVGATIAPAPTNKYRNATLPFPSFSALMRGRQPDQDRDPRKSDRQPEVRQLFVQVNALGPGGEKPIQERIDRRESHGDPHEWEVDSPELPDDRLHRPLSLLSREPVIIELPSSNVFRFA
jgi:hypothetical protein